MVSYICPNGGTAHSEIRYAFGKMWCVAVRDCDGREISTFQECADMEYKITRGYFDCNCPLPPCQTPQIILTIPS